MANAVIDSDGSLSCEMGSEDYDHEADEATDIELEGSTASTIMDVPSSPDFGDCTVWSIITAGSSTDCSAIMIPVWLAGVTNVEWASYSANGDDDTAICGMGGVVTVEDAGTEIEIS